MENSKIEWTTHTFNPWIGCTKVSDGCKNCYAENLMDHRFGRAKWGSGNPRSRTSKAEWEKPLRWNKICAAEACEECDISFVGATWEHVQKVKCPSCGGKLKGIRPRVFCASLADWLDDEIDIFWKLDLLHLIWKTPNLDWLMLTKRPENFAGLRAIMAQYLQLGSFGDFSDDGKGFANFCENWLTGNAPANIWLGTSVENQEQADKRIPELLEIPAKVRFLSCEPLLGYVNLRKINTGLKVDADFPEITVNALTGLVSGIDEYHSHIDWVIVGGESGDNARPMHPSWARSLRDQCKDAGVPFFCKQVGEWSVQTEENCLAFPHAPETVLFADGRRMTASEFVELAMQAGGRKRTCDAVAMHKIGKKLAGRLLDGVEHNGVPLTTN